MTEPDQNVTRFPPEKASKTRTSQTGLKKTSPKYAETRYQQPNTLLRQSTAMTLVLQSDSSIATINSNHVSGRLVAQWEKACPATTPSYRLSEKPLAYSLI